MEARTARIRKTSSIYLLLVFFISIVVVFLTSHDGLLLMSSSSPFPADGPSPGPIRLQSPTRKDAFQRMSYLVIKLLDSPNGEINNSGKRLGILVFFKCDPLGKSMSGCQTFDVSIGLHFGGGPYWKAGLRGFFWCRIQAKYFAIDQTMFTFTGCFSPIPYGLAN